MWEYIKVALIAGWKILFTFPKICRYAKHPEKYPLEERFKLVKSVIKKVVDHWPCEIHKENFDEFKKYEGKRLIVMNHLSFFDAMAFISICDKPITFVAKKESEKYPFAGKYIKAINGVFIDRENLMSQLRSLNETIKMAKDPNGPDVIIFPEGTRNKTPGTRCLEFKAGTFKIAMKSGVAICPVSVYGAFRPLDSRIHMKKYPIYVTCFKPILPEEYENKTSFDVANECQNMIDNSVKLAKITDLEEISKYKMSKKSRLIAEEADRIEF